MVSFAEGVVRSNSAQIVKALARDMRDSAQLREVGLTFEMLMAVRPERAIATVVRLLTRATSRCWITPEAVRPMPAASAA